MDLHTAKTARVGMIYVALCVGALVFAQREQLGLTTDVRDATIRELMRERERADVLCFGTSQTARGVNPAAFERRAEELTGKPWRMLNLAPFGVGRHIGFLEFAAWLRMHPAPQAIVVEVGVTSDLVESMHQMLPRYMDPADAVRVVVQQPYLYRDAREQRRKTDSPPLFDPLGMFRSLDRFAMHLELGVEVLGRGPEDCVRTAFNLVCTGGSPYYKPGEPTLPESVAAQVAEQGFYRVEPDSALGIDGKRKLRPQMERVSYERSLETSWNLEEEVDVFADDSRFGPARDYALAIAKLARQAHVRLVFLDLPNFRGKPLRPSQIAFYSALGELVQPDKAVLYREECFQDPGHLSLVGAEYVSRILAERLAASK